MKMILPAMAYGAARGKIKDMITPFTDMIPAGGNSDELALGLIGYYAAKKGSGLIKNAGMAILTVEAASLGNNLMGGIISPNNANKSPSYSGWV